MKTKVLIIVGIIVALVIVFSVYAVLFQNQCESLLGDTHYPRPLTFWNCMEFMNMVQENTESVMKPIDSEPERTPPPEPPFEKQDPITKIEISFGDRLQNLLVPVAFTEVTTNADDLDKITVWNFELIGHSGDDRYVAWDILPKDRRTGYEITDGDTGLDIINRNNSSVNYMIPADQHLYEMDCGLLFTIQGESAHPTSFPIKNTHTVFAKNSRIGIFPNPNGEYSFEFASIFPSYVRFPEDAVEIVSSDTKECTASWQIDTESRKEHGNGYYTAMTFRFLDNENNSSNP